MFAIISFMAIHTCIRNLLNDSAGCMYVKCLNCFHRYALFFSLSLSSRLTSENYVIVYGKFTVQHIDRYYLRIAYAKLMDYVSINHHHHCKQNKKSISCLTTYVLSCKQKHGNISILSIIIAILV